jgi:hypothetical protein
MRASVVRAAVVAVVVSLAGQARAEEPKPVAAASGVLAPERVRPLIQQAMDAGALPRQPQNAVGRSGQRESIWNGGLIGAAIGGVGGSALIVASRGGSDNIGRAMLNVCVPPALAGFAVGAIVDALR